MENHWKIGDFAKLLGKHTNTVDNWFRTLEVDRKLHYINRGSNGEKIYNEDDLEIAKFIVAKREEKWSLDGIFDLLPKVLELRPFPEDMEVEKEVVVVDFDKMKAAIFQEMKVAMEQVAKEQVSLSLPSKEQERRERFELLLTERKVVRRLEKEALSLWEQQPLEDRTMRVGWFKKVEDTSKREVFVKEYVEDHLEEAMRKELGFQ